MDRPPRRLGRPRLFDEPMASVSTSLPVSALDRLCAVAIKRGCSVSTAARGILMFALRDPTTSTTSTPASTTTSTTSRTSTT